MKSHTKSSTINAIGIKRMLIAVATKKTVIGSKPNKIPAGIEPLNSIPGNSVINII
jgi:hypothetical protein